ncbi:hypothetical protein BH09ACT9_BH09ACT9_00330 [soil metagenome]
MSSTSEQELAQGIAKLKAMGVTISTSRAPGVPDDTPRAVDVIAAAAKDAGIYYEADAKAGN